MFITATEVTVLSNISVTAATIVAGNYIAMAEERLNYITNNYFQSQISIQNSLTFNATARTIVAEGLVWADYGFANNDIVYLYNSYRNDGYKKVLTVSGSTMTCVTGTTLFSELSGQNILVSMVQFPTSLKYTLAQMIKYDVDDRKNTSQNLKSRTLGPWSETFKSDNETNTRNYGYPEDIIGQLAPWTIIGAY